MSFIKEWWLKPALLQLLPLTNIVIWESNNPEKSNVRIIYKKGGRESQQAGKQAIQ